MVNLVFITTLCFLVTLQCGCWAALPSTCLSELIRPSNGHCCTPNNFVHIGFYLRFGCDKPTFLDQGVRLEIDVSGTWIPVRFYTPSLVESDGSLVTLNEDGISVNAKALKYNSDLPLHFIGHSEPVMIHEYLCGSEYLELSSARVRLMQRYIGESLDDVATWSIDNVTISVWNGSHHIVVVRETFEPVESSGGNSLSYIHHTVNVRSGEVAEPSCGPTASGSALYFRPRSTLRIARRSVSFDNLDLSMGEIEHSAYRSGECAVPNSECSAGPDNFVCTKGSFECEDTCPLGYQLVGVGCKDINECQQQREGVLCPGIKECSNTIGSYHCLCPVGYQEGDDQDSCEDIDECVLDVHGCQGVAQCRNTPGSYECECPDGHKLLPDQRSCEVSDIDECEENMHDCQGVAQCHNTIGSYECVCPIEYRLGEDQRSCDDVDECEEGTHACVGVAECSNTIGSYVCVCPSGYNISVDERSCLDIDECEEDVHGCVEIAECSNTIGSYVCVCPESYRLSGDQRSCDDIDECEEGTHGCQGVALCSNTHGSYECVCPDGYSLTENQRSCDDVNECVEDLHGCVGIAQCDNTIGSYECTCPTNYRLSTIDQRTCEDIDECQEDTHDCEGVAECNNTVGSHECICPEGYLLSVNRTSCYDVDECGDILHDCKGLANCSNTIGSYECVCPEGYHLSMDQRSCEDANECMEDRHECEGLAECSNTIGSYDCVCPVGYHLSVNLTSCDDVDECGDKSHDCKGLANCSNTIGSYECVCPYGYHLSMDQRSCEDTNECMEDRHECEGLAECSNNIGSYKCVCPEGYTLQDDLHTCKDVDECLDGTHGCLGVAECNNTIGFYGCVCPVGYRLHGDGRSCTILLDETLDRISTEELTNDTYEELTEVLSEALSASEDSTEEQTSKNLGDIAQYVDKLANFMNDSGVEIESEVVTNLVGTINSLLQWNTSVLSSNNDSSFIVESFEVVASLYAQQVDTDERITVVESDVTFAAERMSLDSLKYNGSSFAINSTTPMNPCGPIIPPVLETVSLPGSLFETIGSDDQKEDVGLFFAAYDTPHLFPVTQDPANENTTRRTMVGSRVLASTVAGPDVEIKGLSEPVSVVLQPSILEPGKSRVNGSEKCVSWSFELGKWTSDGCVTIRDSTDGTITCNCTHLTNFALLVDICTRLEDCQANQKIEKALSYITYFGVSISLIGLVLTIVTLLGFRRLRNRDTSKFHVQLSIAIACMLVLFVVGAERTEVYGICVFMSVFIHYFTLVAVMWMGAQALLMFLKLVVVFVRVTKKFIIALSLFCWLVPIVPVVIPLIVELANGHHPDDDIIVRRNEFCFLSHVGAFWGAFLAIIFVVIIFNIVIFCIVLLVLIKHTVGRTTDKKKITTAARLMTSVAGVMFLFGISWVFAALTFTVPGVRYTFQILFTIFNSLQGFFIFIFFCLLSKEVRECWKQALSCGQYKSEFLHPSRFTSHSRTTIRRRGSTISEVSLSRKTSVYFLEPPEAKKKPLESICEEEPINEKVDLSKSEEKSKQPQEMADTDIPQTKVDNVYTSLTQTDSQNTNDGRIDPDTTQSQVDIDVSHSQPKQEADTVLIPLFEEKEDPLESEENTVPTEADIELENFLSLKGGEDETSGAPLEEALERIGSTLNNITILTCGCSDMKLIDQLNDKLQKAMFDFQSQLSSLDE